MQGKKSIQHIKDGVPPSSDVSKELYLRNLNDCTRRGLEPLLQVSGNNDFIKFVTSKTRCTDDANNIMPECHRIFLDSLQILFLVNCIVIEAINPSFAYFLQVRCGELLSDVLHTNIDNVQEAHYLSVLSSKSSKELTQFEEFLQVFHHRFIVFGIIEGEVAGFCCDVSVVQEIQNCTCKGFPSMIPTETMKAEKRRPQR